MNTNVNQALKSMLTLVSTVVVAATMLVSSMALAEQAVKEQAVMEITTPININSAEAEVFAMLKGVGDKKASDIVAYRDKHGKFNSVDDLLNVKGIGEKTLEHNRKYLSVN